jgi:hypothetical protein
MTDYLGVLAARALGRTGGIAPRRASLFEPESPEAGMQQDLEGLEIDAESWQAELAAPPGRSQPPRSTGLRAEVSNHALSPARDSLPEEAPAAAPRRSAPPANPRETVTGDRRLGESRVERHASPAALGGQLAVLRQGSGSIDGLESSDVDDGEGQTLHLAGTSAAPSSALAPILRPQVGRVDALSRPAGLATIRDATGGLRRAPTATDKQIDRDVTTETYGEARRAPYGEASRAALDGAAVSLPPLPGLVSRRRMAPDRQDESIESGSSPRGASFASVDRALEPQPSPRSAVVFDLAQLPAPARDEAHETGGPAPSETARLEPGRPFVAHARVVRARRDRGGQSEGAVSRADVRQARGAEPPPPAAPDIHISIGRVEVRATPPPATAAPAKPRPGPKLTLEAYMSQRNGDQR